MRSNIIVPSDSDYNGDDDGEGDGDDPSPAIAAPTRATTSFSTIPPAGRVGHSHSSSGSISRANRFSPYGMREQFPVRFRTSQPIASSSTVSGPVTSASDTNRPTDEDHTTGGPTGEARRENERLPQTFRTFPPITNSPTTSGPAISTPSTTRYIGEGSAAPGATERECSICLDSLRLERFLKRNTTSTCNHTPDVCLSCLAQSIATQFSTKVWD